MVMLQESVPKVSICFCHVTHWGHNCVYVYSDRLALGKTHMMVFQICFVLSSRLSVCMRYVKGLKSHLELAAIVINLSSLVRTKDV